MADTKEIWIKRIRYLDLWMNCINVNWILASLCTFRIVYRSQTKITGQWLKAHTNISTLNDALNVGNHNIRPEALSSQIDDKILILPGHVHYIAINGSITNSSKSSQINDIVYVCVCACVCARACVCVNVKRGSPLLVGMYCQNGHREYTFLMTGLQSVIKQLNYISIEGQA